MSEIDGTAAGVAALALAGRTLTTLIERDILGLEDAGKILRNTYDDMAKYDPDFRARAHTVLQSIYEGFIPDRKG